MREPKLRPYPLISALRTAKCTSGIDHIIYNHHVFTFYVSNQCHFSHFVGTFAILITNHHIGSKILRINSGAFYRTHVWCGKAKIGPLMILNIRNENGGTILSDLQGYRRSLEFVQRVSPWSLHDLHPLRLTGWQLILRQWQHADDSFYLDVHIQNKG